MALADSRGERVFTEQGLSELDAREVYEGIQKGEITLYEFERWVALKEDSAYWDSVDNGDA